MGATVARIRGMVVRQVLPIFLIGCGGGLIAAIGLSRFVRSLLFGVESPDPVLLTATAALVTVVAVAATAVPARRAVRIDLAATLRSE